MLQKVTLKEQHCHEQDDKVETAMVSRCSAPVHDDIRPSSSQHICSAYNRQWNKIKRNMGFGDAYGAGFEFRLAIM